jgi:uncharacterized protein YbjT (DUF2867 family)
MKKVIIIGASGSLAGPVIQELQKIKDVHLTLFLRNKNRLHNSNSSSATIIEGDVMDYVALKNAIKGQEIVYVNLAGDLEPMARNIVKAMQETGVKRIIAISSIGIYRTPLKSVLAPYRKLADVIETSGLDYTILRPDWFTNDDEVDYEITRKSEQEKGTALSRKSIASFVATIVKDSDQWKNENLGISKPNS